MPEKSRNYADLPRNLVEEDGFLQRLHDLRIHHRILDEILEELGPAIGRFPEIYPGYEGIHRAKILAGTKHPEIRIWFEFDDETVYLIDIEKTGAGR